MELWLRLVQIKKESDSNKETGVERIQYIVETKGDRTGYKVETKEKGNKKCLHSVDKKVKGRKNPQVIRGHN